MPNADDATSSAAASSSSSSSSSNGARPARNPRPLQPSAAAKKSGGELGSSARSLAVKEAPHVLWNKLKDSGGLSSDALVEEFLKKAAGSGGSGPA
jgi:hypothetical protein